VCVRAKTQNAEGLQLILSTSVWSKTVYHKYKFLKLSMGFETVCPEKDRQTAFYSPLKSIQTSFGDELCYRDYMYEDLNILPKSLPPNVLVTR